MNDDLWRHEDGRVFKYSKVRKRVYKINIYTTIIKKGKKSMPLWKHKTDHDNQEWRGDLKASRIFLCFNDWLRFWRRWLLCVDVVFWTRAEKNFTLEKSNKMTKCVSILFPIMFLLLLYSYKFNVERALYVHIYGI